MDMQTDLKIFEDRKKDENYIDTRPEQYRDMRTAHEKDYGRVIHSGSFRRLQGKTQILNLGDGDFYRTRLTHSLEVSQIARSIVNQMGYDKRHTYIHDLLPDDHLIQSISLAHDIGHPPFGHGGEIALNYCMRDDGGFEGNAHTLRILTRLEKFSEKNGCNLTRRAMLGVLKYPVAYSVLKEDDLNPCLDQNTTAIRILDRDASTPPKCYFDCENDVVDWILDPFSKQDRDLFQSHKEAFDKEGNKKHNKSLYKSFDCSIMDLADDIAYGVHDLEDAISLGLITRKIFHDNIDEKDFEHFLKFIKKQYDEFLENLFEKGSGKRKQYIGKMVNYFVTHYTVNKNDKFDHDLLKYNVGLENPARQFLDALQKLVEMYVIFTPNVQHLEFKGQKMVVDVFEALLSEPKKFLPKDHFEKYEKNNQDKRIICDYIAGMTDGFLLKTYDRLFSPRMGSIFDKL